MRLQCTFCRFLEEPYMPSTGYQIHHFQTPLLPTQKLSSSKLKRAQTSHLRLGKIHVLLDFSLSVKAAPHECVIRTDLP